MNSLITMLSKTQENPEVDWVVGLGLALFIAGASGLWAGVHLRGKTHERLRKPVDIAFQGLTDRAFDTLRELKDHLDELLPDIGEPFDPLSMIVDPSVVERPAKDSIRVLKERHKIHSQFKLLLLICSLLMYFAGAFTALVLCSTLLYFFAYSSPQLWQTSCWVTGAFLGFIILLFVAYSFLETRIQGSIEHANPIPLQRRATSK